MGLEEIRYLSLAVWGGNTILWLTRVLMRKFWMKKPVPLWAHIIGMLSLFSVTAIAVRQFIGHTITANYIVQTLWLVMGFVVLIASVIKTEGQQ